MHEKHLAWSLRYLRKSSSDTKRNHELIKKDLDSELDNLSFQFYTFKMRSL